MTSLSFAAAVVGTKQNTSTSSKDTVDIAAAPVATPTPRSSENAVPSVPSAVDPAPKKNAWSVPVTSGTAEKVTETKTKAKAIKIESAISTKPADNRVEGKNDEQPTATSTKRQESEEENENQKNVDEVKKSAWKKPDADLQSTSDDNSPKDKVSSTSEEQKTKKTYPSSNQSNDSSKGKHKNNGSSYSSSHNGKQKKYVGNKPKQQQGGAGTDNRSQSQHIQQQKGKKSKKTKQNNAGKGENSGGNQNANTGAKSTKKSAKSNNNKKNHNKGHKNRKNMYSQPPPLSPAELEQLKVAVVCQVEYFFSDDELCRNTYLRRNMDCEGFVPAAMIFNFPSIAAYCFQYHDLFAILSERSKFLEIDQVNETLRRRDDFRKWLHPNSEGGFGCPRWIKQVEETRPSEASGPNNAIESVKTIADVAAADDASTGGSNVTPDTDSCTDSESHLEQVGETLEPDTAIVA